MISVRLSLIQSLTSSLFPVSGLSKLSLHFSTSFLYNSIPFFISTSSLFFLLFLFYILQIVEFVQCDREKHVTIPMFSRYERESDNASQKSNASRDKRDDDADWDREIRPMPSVDKLVDDRKVIHSCLHVFRLVSFYFYSL